jgi:prophage regulatory protein
MEMKRGRRVIRWAELSRRIPWTRRWVAVLEEQGRFPKRVRLGPNTVGWFEDEVDALLEARAAERELVP